ncbi:MAG: ATP-binding protein [Eubacterium sp.]|nr:ATP-binding protein [Eubacterium sp.]
MAVYLNTDAAYKDFRMLRRDKYFVDKSGMIEKVNERILTKNRYLCITKPRRFGKTSVLNMLGAYYGKAYASEELFKGLDIAGSGQYAVHLNQYSLIHMNMNRLPEDGDTYADYLALIRETLRDDLLEAYPGLKQKNFRKLSDLLAAAGEEFVFLIDEWDYIFSHDMYQENQSDYLEFFRELLKDKPYVALAYMTGVLPMKKYSMGSALNMFDEYTMLNDSVFDSYFGFTQKEAEQLCSRQAVVKKQELEEWYNGYLTGSGNKIYNPRSVVLALMNGTCQSYWTRTGRMDEVLFFLKYNIAQVRDDIVKMVNHMPVFADIKKEYTAGQQSPANRKEIYAAMIIYGFLSYYEGELRIPDKELMIEFENALEDDDFGDVAELVRNSEEVLRATLAKQEEAVVSYLHNIHNSEIPILQYNDENSLACVVTLAYLSARDKYRIEREEKSGKGFADFIFYPKRRHLPGMVIELKADASPQAALRQIREREYTQKLQKEAVGRILLVGISYNPAKKEHRCRIEEA